MSFSFQIKTFKPVTTVFRWWTVLHDSHDDNYVNTNKFYFKCFRMFFKDYLLHYFK